MRTTIELPDELFRQVKARAALDGQKLKDVITRYVELGLREAARVEGQPSVRRRSPLPVIPEAATGVPIPALSGRALAELELEEDLAKHDRSAGR